MNNNVNNRIKCLPALSLLLVFLSIGSSPSPAASFSITPTSLDLSGGARSGAFSVINSGDEKLNCQIDVKEWSQDPDGRDVYTDAKDIVFFPKIMTVEANEQRAVRVGIKVPAGSQEKTYRLFVEEIPSRKKEQAAKKGTIRGGLTIAFRYATPIFVKPVKAQEHAVVEQVAVNKGVASGVVRSNGNVHVKLLSVIFRGIAAGGKTIFTKTVPGWYVLQGMSRRYETTVPKEVCKDLSVLEVTAQTENAAVKGTAQVQGNMCAQ